MPSVPNLTGLWLLEDGSDAVNLGNQLAGGAPGRLVGGVEPSDDSAYPPGGARSIKVVADSNADGVFAAASASAGWTYSFCVRLDPDLVFPGASQELFKVADSLGRTWSWETDGTDFAVGVYAADGSTLSYVSNGMGYDARTMWARCALRVEVVGANVEWDAYWYQEDATFYGAAGGSFAGTSTGYLASWRTARTTIATGAHYACVLGISDGSTTFQNNGTALAGFTGYDGELAGNRFLRLCDESGISRATQGGAPGTQPMGVQRPDTLLNLLLECRDTEDGLLYDDRTQNRLRFRTKPGRYNQAAVTIDASDLPTLPEEVTDDLGVANDVTVQQLRGSTARAEDTTGPLGTAAPPAGVGRYERRADVNVEDEGDLPQLANWWLRRGTVNLPRYPRVAVNLFTLDDAQRAEIESLDVGSVLEITGYRENPIRLVVIGYTEVIGWPNARTITFTCAPDQQFDVGTYGASTTQRRYDMRTATVKAEAGRADTTLTLKCTDDEEWSNASTYDVMIAGERVTFVAGNMGARTGSAGDYQQIVTNVVRSVNGVRKALPAGSAVHVADQGRWAL
jgi:hypothetical protein